MTLAHRLFLFAVAVMLPVFLIVVLFGLQLGRTREAEVRETVLRQSQQANSEMERIVEGMRTLLVSVASAPVVQNMVEPDCSNYLHAVAAALPQIGSLGVIGLDGSLRCVNDPRRPRGNYGDRDYFVRAIKAKAFTTGIYTAARTEPDRKVLPFSLPILASDGSVKAVIAAGLSLTHLNQVVTGWTLPKGGSLTIADREGTILARNPDAPRFVGTKIPDAYRSLVTAPAPGVREIRSQDGTIRILGFWSAAIPPEGIYVSSGVSKDLAYATARQAWIWNVSAIGLGLICALIASHLLGRTLIHRPIEALIEQAKAWSTGAAPGTLKIQGPKEVQEIGEALNRMGLSLSEQTKHAQENEDRLRHTVKAAPYPLLLQADDGRIVEVNESWWHQSARIDEAKRADPATWSTVKSTRPNVANPFVLPFGEATEAMEWNFVGGDGRERTWEFGVVPLGNLPDGHALRLIAAADVTERNAAARRQELLVAELNHRVKNTLAIVQSIGMQTASHSADTKEFSNKFAIRLQSLARTHDLLTEKAWGEISLRDLISKEVVNLPDATSIAVSGPTVNLPAELAVSVSLVLHELCTNAIKHGCFCSEAGRLEIAWQLEEGVGNHLLRLTWIEICSKPLRPRGKTGFGTRLIARSLEKLGSGESEIRETGLHFRMEIRLPRIVQVGLVS